MAIIRKLKSFQKDAFVITHTLPMPVVQTYPEIIDLTFKVLPPTRNDRPFCDKFVIWGPMKLVSGSN